MGFGRLLDVAGGIFGIIVILGGVIVFLRGSYNKARIDALRQDVQDYKNREEVREEERREDRLRIDRLQAQVDHLETENGMLRELVTSRAQVEELGVLLNDHHYEAVKVWGEIKEAISNGRPG